MELCYPLRQLRSIIARLSLRSTEGSMASSSKTDTPPFMPSSGSLLDSPENSLPGPSTAPQPLSPIETAAEAARIEALSAPEDPAVAAAGRVMAEAAIEAAIQPADVLTDAEVAALRPEDVGHVTLSADGVTVTDHTGKELFSTAQPGASAASGDPWIIQADDLVKRTTQDVLSAQNITVVGGEVVKNQPRTASEITTERNSTHGDYDEMSAATMDFMRVAEASKNWAGLPDGVKVMFFNFAQKQARILTGNPLEPDHYDDLGGYAYLAGKEVRKLKA